MNYKPKKRVWKSKSVTEFEQLKTNAEDELIWMLQKFMGGK
jgi:hypothetical protein